MRPWSAADDRILRECADQGAMALAYMLRRPPSQIRARAAELRVAVEEPHATTASLPDKVPDDYYDLVELYASAVPEICPRCSRGIVVPWDAGGAHGVCPACWADAKAEAAESLARKEEAERRLQAAYKRSQRGRRRRG